MMSESQRSCVRNYGTLVGRVLMGLIFIISGYGMLTGIGVSGVAGMISSYGLPLATLLAVIMLVMKIGGGLALMLGYRVGTASVALIVFTLIATWFGHVHVANFTQEEQVHALKNLAIIGGLLYVLAYGAGEGWKLGKK